MDGVIPDTAIVELIPVALLFGIAVEVLLVNVSCGLLGVAVDNSCAVEPEQIVSKGDTTNDGFPRSITLLLLAEHPKASVVIREVVYEPAAV